MESAIREGLNIQIYSSSRLNLHDFELLGNPYYDEAAVNQLKDLSVVFYRDEDNAYGAVYFDINEPMDGYYYQLILNEEGKIFHKIIENKVRILWMDNCRVNRKTLFEIE